MSPPGHHPIPEVDPVRTFAQRRGRNVVAALCFTALALALAALPSGSYAAPADPSATVPATPSTATTASAATAQGAPARPSPGPAPDPSLTAHALTRADAPLDNPLKGFARFYQPGGNQNTGYPHSLTWSYFGLSEVMNDSSDCGHYDWDVLDDALGETASYGNQAAVRFYIEYPGGSGTHPANAVPPCFAGHVANRTNAYWNTTSPDYDSAYLLDALKDFIAAFGARYDNDPRIGFIHLGLVGLWGEWHTWPYDTDTSGDSYPNLMPTDAHGAELIRAYAAAFTRTKLEVRYPESGGAAANSLPTVGYHDDSFCFREGSPPAGVTLPVSMGGASYSQLQKALDQGVENRWTTASMGGEVRPEIQSTAFDNWPGGAGAVDDMKACLELDHTTWKINEGSAGYDPGNAKVGAAVRQMGYDLTADHAYFQDTAQGTTKVGVRLTNNGVAPFYYPWTVSLGLKDASGNVVKSWATPWDLRKVMPVKIRAFPDWGVGADPTHLDYGHPQYFDTSVDLSGVTAGSYQLVMKARNPLEDVSASAKKLRFANTGQNADGWLALGAMTVGSASGTPRSYEAEASGNTLTGTARTADCTGCSGGSKVGYVGNGAALTFNDVDGGSGGTRTVTVHYASAESRSATVQAGGGTPKTVSFPPTADWATTGTTTVTLDLNAGTGNRITIANGSGWAPDIDRITVS
ncbi:carbohydrate-binding protein [Streptomyces sp. NPDC059517]|uniref:carbohydrate-binding protein n=1 Tax=Streptomyces sp. NPDC059517 TaxID=3346855 RepID=UPI0036C77F07